MIKRVIHTIVLICFGIFLTLTANAQNKEIVNTFMQTSEEHAEPEELLVIESSKNLSEAECVVETDEVPEPEAIAPEAPQDLGFAVAEISGSVNVRSAPGTDSEIVGKMYNGAVAEILALAGEEGDWLQVTSGYVEGYVKGEFFLRDHAAEEYMAAQTELTYAKTIEEDRAEREARRALEEQRRAELYSNIEFPATSYASSEELRKGIVEYALQYVGNRYVHGGKSLADGTDCSGFTCFVYADFGYSISRTPGGQLSSDGRSITAEEIQPGDIICYSSNGGKNCTHVALYIGDGQIVHSANSRKGVIVGEADYSPIIGIKNVID